MPRLTGAQPSSRASKRHTVESMPPLCNTRTFLLVAGSSIESTLSTASRLHNWERSERYHSNHKCGRPTVGRVRVIIGPIKGRACSHVVLVLRLGFLMLRDFPKDVADKSSESQSDWLKASDVCGVPVHFGEDQNFAKKL